MAYKVRRKLEWWAILVFIGLLASEASFIWMRSNDRFAAAQCLEEPCPVIDSLDVNSNQPPISIAEHRRRDEFWAAIDSHALAAPAYLENDPHSLACYLVEPARDDWDKVRAFYRWIADRIRFDDAAYNRGKYGLPDAQALLDLRRGVCDDYAKLFNALADDAGIPSQRVVGFSKGFSALHRHNSLEPDHAWNAFQIDGKWHLIDVTWASGYGEMRGGLLHSTARFEGYWFDTPPEEFIFSHLPSEGKWQLLDTSLSVAEFECLPTVTSDFFKIGFPAAPLLHEMRTGISNEVARVYTHNYDVQVSDMPSCRYIDLGDSLQLRFICTDCGSMSVQTAGRLIDFERTDSLFCMDVKPKKGALRVFARHNRHARRYDGIMEFWVKKSS